MSIYIGQPGFGVNLSGKSEGISALGKVLVLKQLKQNTKPFPRDCNYFTDFYSG